MQHSLLFLWNRGCTFKSLLPAVAAAAATVVAVIDDGGDGGDGGVVTVKLKFWKSCAACE